MKPVRFLSLILAAIFISCQPEEKNILTWEKTISLPDYNGKKSIGFAGPVTGMINDNLLVAGGANFPDALPWDGGAKVYYDIAYILNTSTNQFTETKLPYTIGYTANATTPLGIVAAGGEDQDGATNRVILIKNETLDFEELRSLPTTITNAAATAIGNTVYLAGGETPEGVSNRLFRLNLENQENGWEELATIPTKVSHTILLTDQKQLFLLTGREKKEDGISELFDKVFSYNIEADEWQKKASIPYPLSAGTGALIDQNTIAIFGGDTGETFNKTELIIKEINNETDPRRKSGLEEEKVKIQSGHPGFSKQVLFYHIDTDQWTIGEKMPDTTPVTTTAVKHENTVYIPSGEIKAGVRTPEILKATINHQTQPK